MKRKRAKKRNICASGACVKVIVIVFIVLYILFGLYLHKIQHKYVYFPHEQDFDSCEGFAEAEKAYFNGTRMYYMPGNEKLVVYYHDNTGSACEAVYLKDMFEETGHSYIIVEYAGYSNDSRTPSKELLIQDVKNVVGFVETLDHTEIVVAGYSLGTGLATYHSSIAHVDKMYLVAPYSSMKDIAKLRYFLYPIDLILTENYDSLECVKNFDGKFLIVHGDLDTRIPPRLSMKLFEAARTEDKTYVLVEGAEHPNIHDFDKSMDSIRQFLLQ